MAVDYEVRILETLRTRNHMTHRELIGMIEPFEPYELSHGVSVIAMIAKMVRENKVVINSDQTVSIKS